jgi:hypothetical protein
MPHDIRIVRSQDFVRLDAAGKPDFAQSCRVLAGLAQTCVERDIALALLDARDITPGLTMTELYQLAHAFHEIGFRHNHRLAVLHRYGSADRADFFAMCAKDRGFEVGAFDNYEEAIDWLNRPREERNVPVL